MSPVNDFSLRSKHSIFSTGHSSPMSRFSLDGFAVGDGWTAIIDDMATEIERTCVDSGTQLPEILQIKGKFGALRVVVGKVDVHVRLIIDRAEERSVATCEVCGAHGSLRRDGRLMTRCNAHALEAARS